MHACEHAHTCSARVGGYCVYGALCECGFEHVYVRAMHMCMRVRCGEKG